ncbi:MAG: DUF3604 domain-containing protein, partial [Proteobacteria bacterium]|nr:DUF3604 domain-containing protein [Pseudomonadota bacterium]
GPRMSLRVFAGWDSDEKVPEQADWLEQSYAGGVPMGGELRGGEIRGSSLPKAGALNAPHFILFAGKDPIGANLDRLQVIKAWIDKSGSSHEKIYDVDGSGDRKIDPVTGLLTSVGNTVDVEDASYTNTIGSAQLSALWTDPDFVATQEAFYYARVIEIPTPRYSTYDAKALGVEAPEPATIQERAVSSAIWYQP